MSVTKTLAEINDDAIDILCRDLGVIETIQFINQFTNGSGDYTKERQKRVDSRTVADIIAEIEKRQARKLREE